MVDALAREDYEAANGYKVALAKVVSDSIAELELVHSLEKPVEAAPEPPVGTVEMTKPLVESDGSPKTVTEVA